MKQGLCRRIAQLEKCKAVRDGRLEHSPDCTAELAKLWERVQAWHANPVNQEWLAEQPTGFLVTRVQKFRKELMALAYGRRVAA